MLKLDWPEILCVTFKGVALARGGVHLLNLSRSLLDGSEMFFSAYGQSRGLTYVTDKKSDTQQASIIGLSVETPLASTAARTKPWYLRGKPLSINRPT